MAPKDKDAKSKDKDKSPNDKDAKGSESESERGRFAYDELNRTIHERARLGIMASLAAYPDGLLFADLRRLCDLTDGNLSRHLQVLEEAGLVELDKQGQGRGSQTSVRLTRRGRTELTNYVAALEKVVSDAAAAAKLAESTARGTRTSPRSGWSTS